MKWGVGIAGVYSCYLVIMVLIGGGSDLRKMDLTLPVAVSLYFVAGAVGGAVFGLLWRPGLRYGSRLLITSFIAFIVLTTMMAGSEGSILRWSGLTWGVLLVTSLFFGIILSMTVPAVNK